MFVHDKRYQYLFTSWLFVSLLLVFTIVIVGGLTRLTDSGLSITEWELFKGVLPPLNENMWIKYFNLYKEIPQFKELNSDMTLKEFKIIFYWEYGHRVLGRIIGIFFLVPLIYFHYTKKISTKNVLPFYVILFLIILQGVVGWYMVRSGLVNDVTVSHYRLSLHLTIAFIILSLIFWQLLNIKYKIKKSFFTFSLNGLPFFFLTLLIFLQIIFGAFVSGLDAGKIHQTWPLMGFHYFPDDVILNKFSDFINFNDHSLVQFYHRNIAYIITIYTLVICFYIFKKKEIKLYKPTLIFLIFLLIQITLGIFTLISNLNIALASLHQISSVFLVLSSLNLYYSSIK